MKNLLLTAEKFEKLTDSGGKIVKNNDEILKEISSLKDFDDRIELAEENFDKLGEGSSRTIFQISDSLVLKIAHNEKGLAQNEAEMGLKSPCINNVLVADTEAKWIIVRFTETMSEEDFKDTIGVPFKTFMKALYFKHNNEIHDDRPDDYDEIVQNPFFKCISKTALEHDLQIGDVAKTSSWGLLDGKPVLRDFGLTKDVFIDYYECDSDNETSTI
jgi:hypothetical protein